ncbi:MAG: DUF512 domain-containing protein [Clostridia bacterium]|nr:DUF512 domain-containing protein [Clostridia bacterium]
MNGKNVHRIADVESGGIAAGLGIAAGDELLLVNGAPVVDVFDYRTAMAADEVSITVRTADGVQEYIIEKDEDEDIGLLFDSELMDTCRTCTNRCVFCFIDQLPRGMRPSLYFKDDDLRMSFLSGNYVTLTNLSDSEFDRLIGYRLSPMNISVHALAPEVRCSMMNNRFAGDILERLRRITESRISVNIQIVLVPGINDGRVLEETLQGLLSLGDRLSSISVVPVGLTRYRDENGLPELHPFSPSDAGRVLDEVRSWQERLLAERGSRTVYASDEMYLRAGRPLPDAGEYEDFPQLENGVGMAPLFALELEGEITRRRAAGVTARASDRLPSIHAVTGTDFAPMLDRLAGEIRALYGFRWTTHAVRNRFFGETVAVAGLLTAADIADQLATAIQGDPGAVVLVPDVMLRAERDVFLDDWTPSRLGEAIGAEVVVCGSTAPELMETLDRMAGEGRTP